MPLTPDEYVALGEKALEFGDVLGRVFRRDSPGGRRVTKQERQELLKAGSELVWMLARDLAD